MPNTPHEDRWRWIRRAATACLALAWVVILVWLWRQASTACVSPDPPPGGCSAGGARANEHFEFWFVPLLLAGPVVMLGVWAGFSPKGQKYGPLWYLLAVLFFCAAPGMLFDAASASFAAVDGASALTLTERLVADVKLASGALAAIGAPAGLAYLTYRRGHRTYAKVWTTCAIASAGLVLVMSLSVAL